VETTYGGYARLQFPLDTSKFSDPTATAEAENTAVVEFPQASSTGIGNLVGFDMVDTASGAFNHVWLWGPISPSRSVIIGKKVRFPISSLIFTA
jgi:hypothetical protein